MTESNLKSHLTDEALELYAMGRLPERELAGFEEHLLVCASCQNRLDQYDEYVSTMFKAQEQLAKRPEAQEHKSPWVLGWPALAFAMTAAVLIMIILPRWSQTAPAQVVELAALRSAPNTAAKAPQANRPLELRLARNSAMQATEVRIVDSAGVQVWSGSPVAQGDRLVVRVDKGLAPGNYYVRSFARTELLNEYTLLLQ